MQGTVMKFGGLDNLLWGIVATIQYYSLPVMAISAVGIGLAMIMSGDDTERKGRLKTWLINICIGGTLVFGATALATMLKGFFTQGQ